MKNQHPLTRPRTFSPLYLTKIIQKQGKKNEKQFSLCAPLTFSIFCNMETGYGSDKAGKSKLSLLGLSPFSVSLLHEDRLRLGRGRKK